ncbi:T9SS type A sorting domain-containing protein [Hymenobacter sp. B1770]|uniref:T9SS type A sorting domain-containing protein n=1 Tax=Hymenobacter sp. B1770 TaxID=1718788 RepID=UPI003CE6EDB8
MLFCDRKRNAPAGWSGRFFFCGFQNDVYIYRVMFKSDLLLVSQAFPMKDFLHFPFGFLLGLLCLVLVVEPARAQSPIWQTVITPQANGSVTYYIKRGVAIDANGNVYTIGYFNGTITFGSTTLVSGSTHDGFIAKWSPATSSYVWAQHLSGATVNGIAASGTSVYITGFCLSSPTIFGTITNTAGPDQLLGDAFVAKLTDAGSSATWNWVQRVGGSLPDDGRAIAVNGSAVYVTGMYESPTLALGTAVLRSQFGVPYGFVTRLNDLGTSAEVIWGLGIYGRLMVNAIAVANSNVYVGGTHGYTGVGFDSTPTYINMGGGDPGGFIAKLTEAGTSASAIWTARTGQGRTYDRDPNSGVSYTNGLAVSGSDVYTAGGFSGRLTFGSTVVSSPNATSLLVTKLTDAGATATFRWVQAVPPSAGGSAGGDAIAVTNSGVYVAGGFSGAVLSFGNNSLTQTPGAAPNTNDLFVAKFASSDGSSIWAKAAGGPENDGADALAVGNSGRVYVVGLATPPAQFGSLSLGGTSVPSIYLASLNEATATANTPLANGLVINLLPNPAHGRVIVQLPPSPSAVKATLTVVDAMGRLVRTHTIALPAAGLPYELDLTRLSAGLYGVRVEAGTQVATRRLAVE